MPFKFLLKSRQISEVDTFVSSGAEAIAGTNDTKAITPLKLRNGLNASGTAPIYACRAWVNFNGTGVVTIRGSGNVSSITDEGTGKYKVNFTNAIEDDKYSVAVSGAIADTTDDSNTICISPRRSVVDLLRTTLLLLDMTYRSAITSLFYDTAIVSVAIFK